MERDFLGLNSKDSLVVKEVAVEGCKDSGSVVEKPLPGEVAALPLCMSFHATQDEKTAKSMSNPLASSGFMTISTAAAFDATKKSSSGEKQTYPVQQNVLSHNLSHNFKKLPAADPPISASMCNPIFQTHFTGGPHNCAGSTMRQELHGGIPVTSPHLIIPSTGSVGGTTETRFNSKPSGAHAQLTIFYAGMVKVYDDVSPEKAQAVMRLARNGSASASKVAHPIAQVQIPIFKQSGSDRVLVNCPTYAPLGHSGLSSPISVSSHTVGHSGIGPNTIGHMEEAKLAGIMSNPVNKVDPPKNFFPIGHHTVATVVPASVPQAPKASLVRFLEKRKERLMNATPYNLGKKSPELTNIPGPSQGE